MNVIEWNLAGWADQLIKDGYAVLPELICEPEIQAVLNVLTQAGQRKGRAGMRHVLGLPEVRRMAESAAMMSVARKILGPGAVPFRATLFDKSPSSNWLVAWHQDTALPLCERRETNGWGPWSTKDGILYAHAPAEALEKVVALRVHLDDSDSDNGPMRVLPGTHQQGVMSDSEIHKLAEKAEGVDCIAPRRSVVSMRPLVVHASSKAIKEKPRRVLHVEYAEGREVAPGMNLASA